MASRRSPQQTLLSVVVILAGIWIAMWIYDSVRDDRLEDLPEQLPDLELRDLSPEELYQQPGFERHDNAPRTWDDISLRFYAEDEGAYTRFLRCTIDAEEVEAVNPDVFRPSVHRRREVDDAPPDWWPGLDRAADDPWAVPDWWRPGDGGVGNWWALPDRDTVVGMFLHYHPETRVMHLWEWRRHQSSVDPPPDISGRPVADLVATRLAHELATAGHPVTWGDWLHAPEFPAPRAASLVDDLPEGLTGVSALLRPKREMRYLLAFHGLDRAQAEGILGDVAVRAVEADSPPPVEAWAHALPQEAGEPVLPPWFDPGPGPRWQYRLARPGSGQLDAARWAAYDPAARSLYIWDWRNP